MVSEAVELLEAMAATLGQPASTHPPEVRVEEAVEQNPKKYMSRNWSHPPTVRLVKADENDVSIPYDAAAFLAYDGFVETVDYAIFRVQYEANAVAEVIAKRKQRETAAAATAAKTPAAAAPPAPPQVAATAGTPKTTTTTQPPQIASSADEAAITDVGDRAYLILQDLGVF